MVVFISTSGYSSSGGDGRSVGGYSVVEVVIVKVVVVEGEGEGEGKAFGGYSIWSNSKS